MWYKKYLILLAIASCLVQVAEAVSVRCRDNKALHFYNLTVAGQVACMNDNLDDRRDVAKHHRKRRVAIYKLKWPKSGKYVEIPYDFDPSTTSIVRDAVALAITEFSSRSCIRFRKRRAHDFDYVYITSQYKGCSADVGRKGGQQILNLEGVGCSSNGIVVHELMHALSFDHTMVRQDVNRYIYINFTNIIEDFRYNFMQHADGDGDVLGEEFCYSSVMMYGRKDFAIDPQIDVLTPLIDPNAQLGSKANLSECDISQLNRLYQCMDYLQIKNKK